LARDIIVVGASAGGVEALANLVTRLPRTFPASIFVTLHVSSESMLPEILSRAGSLPAEHVTQEAKIGKGRIYVASPDRHLVFGRGLVKAWRGPRENGHRPAIDPLFRTAAEVYCGRVVGVLLSGSGDDGTMGLTCVKQAGGVAIVQDPLEALHPRMPRSALENVEVDACLPVREMVPLLERLAVDSGELECSSKEPPMRDELRIQKDKASQARGERTDTSSVLTCPDCGGVLWELENGGPRPLPG